MLEKQRDTVVSLEVVNDNVNSFSCRSPREEGVVWCSIQEWTGKSRFVPARCFSFQGSHRDVESAVSSSRVGKVM